MQGQADAAPARLHIVLIDVTTPDLEPTGQLLTIRNADVALGTRHRACVLFRATRVGQVLKGGADGVSWESVVAGSGFPVSGDQVTLLQNGIEGEVCIPYNASLRLER